MYTVISQIYIVNKIMSFFFFFFFNEHKTFFFNIYLEINNSWPCVIIHVSNWRHVFYTRVYLDVCILYTCPIGVFIQLATLSKRHVANWTRVYSNRYCRHASKCRVFCSEPLATYLLLSKGVCHAPPEFSQQLPPVLSP
jgi:hypothetical protein